MTVCQPFFGILAGMNVQDEPKPLTEVQREQTRLTAAYINRLAVLLAGIAVVVLTFPAAGRSDARVTSGVAEERVEICHGYGCTFRSKLSFSASDERRFTDIMMSGKKSPAAERAAISRAVRYFETRTRQATGFPDQPKSGPGAASGRGQMDCIDELTNTRTLLKYLEKRRLLKHHSVARNASRGFFLDGRYPHSTAVVRDYSGTKWAVDSWYAPMGGAPDILPLRDWLPRGFLASGELTRAERRSGL